MPRIHSVVPRDLEKESVPEHFEGPHIPRKAPRLLKVNPLPWTPVDIPKEVIDATERLEGKLDS